MDASKPNLNGTGIGTIKLSLENCILPQSRFECTPSSSDGLEPEYEYELRVLGTELIQSSGILLKLPQVAMATGQVLFQRFYYCKSFVRYPMEITAMACILLASKIEEAPRRVRDVANVFHYMKQIRTNKTPQPFLLDNNYINLKTQIVRAERRLLKELGFCVHVKHPHKFIVTLLQVLGNEKNHRLMQTSWNYMNDSLRTDVFLRHPPETIACACVYLSANLLCIPLPTKPAWYEVFGVNESEIKAICLMILKLYARKKPDQAKLESIVDELKKQYEISKLKAKGIVDNGESEIKNGQESTTNTGDKNDKEEEKEKDREKSPEKSSVYSKSPKVVKEISERIKRKSPLRESPRKYDNSTSKSKVRSTLKTRTSHNDQESPSYGTSPRRRSPARRLMYKARSRSKERKEYDKDRDRKYSSHHYDYHHHRRHHNSSSKSRSNH